MYYSIPVIMMFVTLAILVSGVVLMVLGNRLNISHSTKMMCMRIISQSVVVILMAALYFFQRG